MKRRKSVEANSSQAAVAQPATSTDANSLLALAVDIAEWLCETAIMDMAGYCNWVARRMPQGRGGYEPVIATALTPDIYSGTAGVAIFLADVARITNQASFGDTACAALRRSREYLHRYGGGQGLSVFSGRLGVLYGALRLADLLNERADATANEIAIVAEEALGSHHVLDVIGGNAGAVMLLLSLARERASDSLMRMAERCGEELCQRAVWNGDQCWWDNAEAGGVVWPAPLGGFAHGTAGMAMALLQLYEVTGDLKYLTTAQGAFRYEDTLLDPERQYWVDARFPFDRSKNGAIDGTFATAWCHGAGGIALARLHATTVDRAYADEHERFALMAVRRIIAGLDEFMVIPRYDASLCHGICGLSEILLVASEYREDLELKAKCLDVVTRLMKEYPAVSDWPCGTVGNAAHPSLMLGLSGIGHHCLHLGGYTADSIVHFRSSAI